MTYILPYDQILYKIGLCSLISVFLVNIIDTSHDFKTITATMKCTVHIVSGTHTFKIMLELYVLYIFVKVYIRYNIVGDSVITLFLLQGAFILWDQ
jgi:hypothetical protein